MPLKMAFSVFKKPLRFVSGQTISNVNTHFSTSFSLTNKWRRKQGLEPNPNHFGPLRFSPDYSFVDGRPVPLSQSAIRNLKLQEEYCRKIVQLTGEIDFAVERYKKLQEEEKENRKRILSAKLKPKGKSLLKSNAQEVSKRNFLKHVQESS